ncbi:MAG: dihydroneopterin aldolase [Bacteroidota bacterium]
MSQIRIKGMEFYAHHGCYTEEQIIGGHYRVDITIDTDYTEAAKEDDLKKTINYQLVYEEIKIVMQKSSKLIEHVAYNIIQALRLKFPEAEKFTVTVSKLNPPIGGKTQKVSVTLEG